MKAKGQRSEVRGQRSEVKEPRPEVDYCDVLKRKGKCGYTLQPSCANCQHVIHYYAICKKHRFPVNKDHGICRDFAMIGSQTLPGMIGSRGARTLPGMVGPARRAGRKTITKRSK